MRHYAIEGKHDPLDGHCYEGCDHLDHNERENEPMSIKPKWVTDLESEPCECVCCPICKGTGTVYYLLGEYCGPHHPCDDLAEPESCEECSNGVAETCDRCNQLESYYFDEIRDAEHEH